MASVFPSIVKCFRQAWGYLAHPYHLYHLRLKCVTFDKRKRAARVIFSVENFNSETSVMLQKVFQEEGLISNLHPLEVAILEVLAAEERYHDSGEMGDFERLMEPFGAFESVDSYFFAEHTGRNMLVLNLEDGEHELCMSVRELANSPEHIHYLLESSILPTISAIDQNAAQALT